MTMVPLPRKETRITSTGGKLPLIIICISLLLLHYCRMYIEYVVVSINLHNDSSVVNKKIDAIS